MNMKKAIYLGVAAALVSTVALAQNGPRGAGMKAADANNDGAISWAEAQAASAKRFAAMDTDRNGKVSKDERLAKRRTMRDREVTSAEFAARAKTRFDRVDSNRDGKIDSAELAAVKTRFHGRRG